MKDQVLHLHHQGFTIRRISKSLKISRNTVRGILRSDGETKEEPKIPDWARSVNWETVRQEHSRGVTLKVLHQELAAGISYKIFWHHFRGLVPATKSVTIRLEHKPGEKTFFDFADGIDVVDARTGEVTTTQLFVGVLPFSSLTVGEFVLNQKQPTMIGAVENCFYQIGGVTPYVTVDNLRSAVRKSHLYDPDVNAVFVEFANHWGFAVLPTRPYHPKDKAAVEAAIGVIQRQFFNEVRKQVFHSLSELNAAFRDFLKKLNAEAMKDHGGVSRNDRFSVEKPLLKPLARDRYELSDWKYPKVHPDCHVQLDRRFYSVPYQFIGQTVRARMKSKIVELFTEDGTPIAVHPRLEGSERSSTLDAHYPPEQIAAARFELKSALRIAQRIGPKTESLVEDLTKGNYPLRYLRRIQGILRLHQSGIVQTLAMEYGCEQAMLFNKKNFNYIKQAALFFESGGKSPRLVTPRRDPSDLYLHQTHEENP